METINLIDIIGSDSAISPRAGRIAFDFVAIRMSRGSALELSFEGINDLSSTFCDALFGRLYVNYEPAMLNKLLKVTGVPDGHFRKRMIEGAIRLGMAKNGRERQVGSLESEWRRDGENNCF